MIQSTRRLLVTMTMATVGLVVVAEDAREPKGPLPVDRRVLRFVLEHRSANVVLIAKAFSHLGDPIVMVGLAVVATAVLWRRARSHAEALAPAAALLVGSIIETATKQIIDRPRPAAVYHLLHETDPSFPSGHATGSAAFLVATGLVVATLLPARSGRLWVLAGLALLAATVGAARVVLGVHWMTDVVAGWFLGVACATGTVLAAGPSVEPMRRRLVGGGPAAGVEPGHRRYAPPRP